MPNSSSLCLIFILSLVQNKGQVICFNNYQCAISFIETYVSSTIGSVVYFTNVRDYENKEDAPHKNALNFATSSRTFLIVTPGMTEVINITKVVHKLQAMDYSTIVIFHDFTNLHMMKNMLTGGNIKQFKNIKWLYTLSDENTRQSDIRQALLDYADVFQNYISTLQIEAQLYAIDKMKGFHRIYEIYQVCERTDIVIHEITKLLNDDNRACTNSLSIWENRGNLQKCPLRVGYFNYGSVIQNKSAKTQDLSNHKNGQKTRSSRQELTLNGVTLYGPTTQFFGILQAKLNFSVDWVYAIDERFGSLDNDNWDGLIGMVQRNEIDTSILDLSITKDRSSFVSFTTPFRYYKIRLFMSKPQSRLQSWKTFLQVLDLNYWIAMIVSFIFCVACIFISNLVNENFDISKIEIWPRFSMFGISIASVARAFACMDVNSTYNILTRGTKSARILIFIVCICGMVNYQVYNAGLISSLMVQRYELPIKRLDEILTKPGFKLLFTGGAVQESFLKHSNYGKHREIWEKNKDGILSSEDDGEKQILADHKKILLALSPDFEMMFDTFPCKVVSSKKTYTEYPSGYVFSKESNLLNVFSYHVQQIKEKGLETEWFDGQKYTSMECDDDSNGDFITLSYNEVISAFFLLVLGCFIGLTNMILEYGCKNWLLRTKLKN